MLRVVLYEPEIPQNTGNIGRLCVNNDLSLHLIEPLGFQIDEKQVRRSGLDYWPHLRLRKYANWGTFQDELPPGTERAWFFSTKAEQSLWEADFQMNDLLVFGPETRGLPIELLRENWAHCLKVPLLNRQHARSLNLATCVGIAVYEALRQILRHPNHESPAPA